MGARGVCVSHACVLPEGDAVVWKNKVQGLEAQLKVCRVPVAATSERTHARGTNRT